MPFQDVRKDPGLIPALEFLFQLDGLAELGDLLHLGCRWRRLLGAAEILIPDINRPRNTDRLYRLFESNCMPISI